MVVHLPEHAYASDRPSASTASPPRHVPGDHDDRMAGRQMSCHQQTAPPQSRCSKDVIAHPHRPRDRPGRPCPVPACIGQSLPGKRRFSSRCEQIFLDARRVFVSSFSSGDRSALHCRWNAIATQSIGIISVQARGILPRPEEQSRTCGCQSGSVEDQPNVQGCSIVAAPMHAPSRTSLLLPLLLSHNLSLSPTLMVMLSFICSL